MTDLGKLGFGVDTGPMKELNAEIDVTKEKVRGLNEEMQKTGATGQTAATGIDRVATAASGVKNAGLETAVKGIGDGMSTAAAGATKTAQAIEQTLTPAVQKSAGFLQSFKQSFIDAFVTATTQSAVPIARAGQLSQQLDEYVKSTGKSYTEASAAIAGATAAQSSLSDKVLAGSNAIGTLGQTTRTVSGAVDEHAAKTKTMASEHGHASESAKNLREAVHTIAPALEEAGLKMTALTQFSGATRAGMAALGVAIAGSLVVELGKLGDEVEKEKARLEGFAGIRIGDQLAAELEKIKDDVGHISGSLAPAVEQLIKFQQLQPSEMGHSFDSLSVDVHKVTDEVRTLFEALHAGGASSKEALGETTKFFQDAATQGKVTAQSFERLQSVAPATAQMFASAFTNGRMSAAQFTEELRKQPATLESFLRVLDQVGQKTHAVYADMIANPKTVEDAVTKLQGAFTSLWKASSGGDAPNQTAAKSISFLADGFNQLSASIPKARQEFDLATNAAKSWGDVVKVVADENSIWGSSIEIDIVAATQKGLLAIGEFVTKAADGIAGWVNSSIQFFVDWGTSITSAVGEGLDATFGAIGRFVMNSLQTLTDWANQAIALANSVGTALANSVSGGGGTPQTNAMGDVTGSAENSVPGFATGGSFTVGGSGGTDTTLVKFWATPGEKVTIEPPGAANSNAPSGAPTAKGGIPAFADGGSFTVDGSSSPDAKPMTLGDDDMKAGDAVSAHFKATIETQTAALSDRINAARDNIAAAVNNAVVGLALAIKTISSSASTTPSSIAATTSATTATAAATAATAASASSGGGGGGGGGGGTGSKDPNYWSKEEEQAGKAADAQNKADQSSVNAAQAAVNQKMRAASQADARAATQAAAQQSRADSASSSRPVRPFNNDDQAKTPYWGPGATDQKGHDYPMRAPPSADAAPKQDLQKQTDTLKQSQDKSGQSVADAVKTQDQTTKSIGDQTNESLSGVDKGIGDVAGATKDSSKSMEAVQKSTDKSAEAIATGNDQASAASDEEKSQLDENKQATSDVGDATKAAGEETKSAVSEGADKQSQAIGANASSVGEAVSNGSNSIVDAVNSSASTISDAVSSAVAGSNNGSSGAGSQVASASDAGDQGFATGGQFTVKGAGGTDTEHVEFWASPGETVTITPPGGTAPPNPSMAEASKKSGIPAFANGGQITLGQLEHTPTMPTSSADLVSAHMKEDFTQLVANLKDKLESIASKIVDAINNGAITVSNAVTAALAKMEADAKAAAVAQAKVATTPVAAAQASGASSLETAYLASRTGGGVAYKGYGGGGGVNNLTGHLQPAGTFYHASPVGGMAEGGTFIVPGGGGGSDSVNVAIKASPGERIMVIPPAEADQLKNLQNTIRVTPEPLSKFMPQPVTPPANDDHPTGINPFGKPLAGLPAMPAWRDHGPVAGVPVPAPGNSGAGPAGEKNVNIFVQQGVQADSFIRSRAEIQRALGR